MDQDPTRTPNRSGLELVRKRSTRPALSGEDARTPKLRQLATAMHSAARATDVGPTRSRARCVGTLVRAVECPDTLPTMGSGPPRARRSRKESAYCKSTARLRQAAGMGRLRTPVGCDLHDSPEGPPGGSVVIRLGMGLKAAGRQVCDDGRGSRHTGLTHSPEAGSGSGLRTRRAGRVHPNPEPGNGLIPEVSVLALEEEHLDAALGDGQPVARASHQSDTVSPLVRGARPSPGSVASSSPTLRRTARLGASAEPSRPGSLRAVRFSNRSIYMARSTPP